VSTQQRDRGRAFEAPYPIYVDLADRRVLVVGGGKVAERKVASLIEAKAQVIVVSPDATAAIRSNAQIRWHPRQYRRGEVASYSLAFASTDDRAVNAQVAKDGEAANVFVNSADDPPNCSFILPAVAKHGDFQIAISTNGRSPAMAKWLRQELEQQITSTYSDLLDLVAAGNLVEARSALRSNLGLPAQVQQGAE